MHQLWGYKVEETLYLGIREQKRLNTTGIVYPKIFSELGLQVINTGLY
jgi:hypothetical protein